MNGDADTLALAVTNAAAETLAETEPLTDAEPEPLPLADDATDSDGVVLRPVVALVDGDAGTNALALVDALALALADGESDTV